MDDKTKPSITNTKIDLGDDLLDKTATLVPEARDGESVPELLENAKILLSEGFFDEAKKALRKVLLKDQNNPSALKRLGDIHELELKQIFGEEKTQNKNPKTVIPDLRSSRELMHSLDRDFGLGIFDLNGGELSPAESIFEDEKAMEKFASHLDREHADAPAKDRMDLGIAFLEMGFYVLAIRQFQAASRSDELRVPALILESTGMILAGRLFQATLSLEALARESELEVGLKSEIFYLLGRAYEALSKSAEARSWYRQVQAINPDYRDVEARLIQ